MRGFCEFNPKPLITLMILKSDICLFANRLMTSYACRKSVNVDRTNIDAEKCLIATSWGGFVRGSVSDSYNSGQRRGGTKHSH